METICNRTEDCLVEVKVTFTTEEWKDAQDSFQQISKKSKN